MQLQNLVDRKLQDVQKAQLKITVSGKEVVVREQVRKVVHAILSAKDAIGSAVTAEPHAALAWAGVLVILPVSITITIASAFHAEICPAVVSEPDYAGGRRYGRSRIYFRPPCPVQSYRDYHPCP